MAITFFLLFCNLFTASKSHDDMTDAELVRMVLSGNENACSHLVLKYQKLVNHVVRRMVLQDAEAEDLCQDIFLRVFRRLHTFRGEARLSTWIATIAYNTSATWLKKNKLMKKLDLEEAEVESLMDKGTSLSERADAEEMKRIILASIEKLPLHYRTVLTLFYLDEFSCREIGEITGMPEGTIKNYLHRSRTMLKNKLEKILDDEGKTIFS